MIYSSQFARSCFFPDLSLAARAASSPKARSRAIGPPQFNGMQFEASGYVGEPFTPPAYFNVVSGGIVTINSALENSLNNQPVDFGTSSSYAGKEILTGSQVGTPCNMRSFNVPNGIL